VSLALRLAEKCMKDECRETEFCNEDSLVWSTVYSSSDNIGMRTLVLLLKLHFCDVYTYMHTHTYTFKYIYIYRMQNAIKTDSSTYFIRNRNVRGKLSIIRILEYILEY
jgi:hypothetical protein